MAKAPKKLPADVLTHALIAAFDPLIFALDSELNDEGIGQKRNAALDAGTELPSMRDSSLHFLLDNLCRTLWRQNYAINQATRKRQNGTEYVVNYDNNEQRLLNSKNTKEILDSKDLETWTESDIAAQYWYYVNEARFNAIEELLAAFQNLYEEVYRKPWEPGEKKAVQAKPVVPADITAERAKMMKERFAKLEARKG